MYISSIMFVNMLIQVEKYDKEPLLVQAPNKKLADLTNAKIAKEPYSPLKRIHTRTKKNSIVIHSYNSEIDYEMI